MDVPVESAFSLLDSCQKLPSYLSWVCGENTKAVLVLLLLVALFGSLIDKIVGLKTAQFLWKVLKAFIRGSFKESFGEPKLRPWVNKVPLRARMWLFWCLSGFSVFLALFAFLYSYLGWYPLFWVPFERMNLGILSYPILLVWASFFVMWGVLSIGNAIQFFRLGRGVQKQLNTSLNRTRSKQRAG